MTELIGTHQVPCISDTDYAAYPLLMQCIANQVEAALSANADAASAALHHPLAVWQQSQNLTQGTGSASQSATFLYGYNWSPTYNLNVLATLNRQGWWLFGGIVHCTSSAPVAGNNRTLSMNIYPPGLAPAYYGFTAGAPFAVASFQDVTWETNTGGGEDLFIASNVYCAADPNAGPDDKGMQIQLGLSVENSGAETVTFLQTYWTIFLGDTPLIQAS